MVKYCLRGTFPASGCECIAHTIRDWGLSDLGLEQEISFPQVNALSCPFYQLYLPLTSTQLGMKGKRAMDIPLLDVQWEGQWRVKLWHSDPCCPHAPCGPWHCACVVAALLEFSPADVNQKRIYVYARKQHWGLRKNLLFPPSLSIDAQGQGKLLVHIKALAINCTTTPIT